MHIQLWARSIALGLLLCGCFDAGKPSAGDSQTHWLERCDADADCKRGGACACGVCTEVCGSSKRCSGAAGLEICARSGSEAFEALCEGVTDPLPDGVCLAACEDRADCGPKEKCIEATCVLVAGTPVGGEGGSGGSGSGGGAGSTGGGGVAGGAGSSGGGGSGGSGTGGSGGTTSYGCSDDGDCVLADTACCSGEARPRELVLDDPCIVESGEGLPANCECGSAAPCPPSGGTPACRGGFCTLASKTQPTAGCNEPDECLDMGECRLATGPQGNAYCRGSDGACSFCLCAAPDTPIATPDGERPIAELREGDLVMSMDRGEWVAVPVMATGQRAVTGHAVVHIELSNGAYVEISGSHPTAQGTRLDSLVPGDSLGEVGIVSMSTVPYPHSHTYDILPASDSGTYLAAGALMGSTLFSP